MALTAPIIPGIEPREVFWARARAMISAEAGVGASGIDDYSEVKQRAIAAKIHAGLHDHAIASHVNVPIRIVRLMRRKLEQEDGNA